jgi:pyrroloquinoline quinone (PQQ) biosynthesis protein C
MSARVEKKSVAMPPALVSAAEEAAQRANVSFSAWVSAAVAQRLKLQKMSEAIAAYEVQHGEITNEDMAGFESTFGLVR